MQIKFHINIPVSAVAGLIFHFLVSANALSADSRAFSHKLIFSETPEIGAKWSGGLRANSLAGIELGWNINSWFYTDFLYFGSSKVQNEADAYVFDNFSLFTLKTPPFTYSSPWGAYQAAAGLKFYRSEYRVIVAKKKDDGLSSDDESTILFLSQGITFQRLFFNFFTAVSQREKRLPDDKTEPSFTGTLVPGFRLEITRGWGLQAEYYISNAEQLPLKGIQFKHDSDGIVFFNPERQWHSFLLWGLAYSGVHLRLDLGVGHHPSFSGPFFPLLSAGWNF